MALAKGRSSKTKSQVSDIRTIGPLVVIYSHSGHLDHVTWAIYINFCPLFLRMLSDDDGRTPEHDHPISSTCEPSAQVSLLCMLLSNIFRKMQNMFVGIS